jgi:hypothetical protein
LRFGFNYWFFIDLKITALALIDKENPVLARNEISSSKNCFLLARTDLGGKRETAQKK